MDRIVYSTDVAALAAQLGAILVIAFMVELRALGLRRALDGKDARGLLGSTFGSFGVLLVVALGVVNGGVDVRGTGATWAWFLTGAPLLLLTFLVALAGWAGMQISERDVRKRERSEGLLDERLREPGWKWLLLKSKGGATAERLDGGDAAG